jgi:hypothetical protein
MAERGYPKKGLERIADLQRSSLQYRGRQTATQWIFISQSRRGGYGYLDYEGAWGDGDPDAPGQFCMDEHGRIRLRGRIAGGAINTVVFQLPPGYSPPVPQRFNLANGDAGYAIIEIDTEGVAVVTGIV